MEKLKVRPVILVEGKYDKIRLESIVDGFILPTDGFRIFSDPERLAMIRRLAATRGVLVLTDSDGAGFVIRNYLSGVLPKGQVFHAYIPDLPGKERRKRSPSKAGLLGVEGMDRETIVEALRRAGVSFDDEKVSRPQRTVTKADLFDDGLSGGQDSSMLRARLLSRLGLPRQMSANAMLQAINSFLSYEEYRGVIDDLHREQPQGEGESR